MIDYLIVVACVVAGLFDIWWTSVALCVLGFFIVADPPRWLRALRGEIESAESD